MNRFLRALGSLLTACGGASSEPHTHGDGQHHHAFSDPAHLAKKLDDPSRDAWQQPDAVIAALALEPAMHVADIGAGTGYFSVRLARAVPDGAVIATDVEPNLVAHLTARAQREGLPNLRAVLAPPASSGLAPASVDRILVVHVWHHLADRVALARDLAAALRPGGRLLVVDFAPDARRGPPPEMRLAPGTIIAELEAAGLRALLSPTALPDQFIVEARRGP